MKTEPTKRTMPQISDFSCSQCEFFKLKMVHSGRGYLYRSYCKHPANAEAGYTMTNTRLISGHGDDRTPVWSPMNGETDDP